MERGLSLQNEETLVRPFSVLVVDDEPSSVWPLLAVCKKLGIEARYVSDIEDVTLELKSQYFDLVITDWIYPECEGDAIIDEVIAETKGPDAPLIVVHSGLDKEILNIPSSQVSYVSAFWKKPLSPRDIFFELSHYLYLRG